MIDLDWQDFPGCNSTSHLLDRRLQKTSLVMGGRLCIWPLTLPGGSPGAPSPTPQLSHHIAIDLSCRVVLKVRVLPSVNKQTTRAWHGHGNFHTTLCDRQHGLEPYQQVGCAGAQEPTTVNSQQGPRAHVSTQTVLQSTLGHLNFSQSWRTPVPPFIMLFEKNLITKFTAPGNCAWPRLLWSGDAVRGRIHR